MSSDSLLTPVSSTANMSYHYHKKIPSTYWTLPLSSFFPLLSSFRCTPPLFSFFTLPQVIFPLEVFSITHALSFVIRGNVVELPCVVAFTCAFVPCKGKGGRCLGKYHPIRLLSLKPITLPPSILSRLKAEVSMRMMPIVVFMSVFGVMFLVLSRLWFIPWTFCVRTSSCILLSVCQLYQLQIGYRLSLSTIYFAF